MKQVVVVAAAVLGLVAATHVASAQTGPSSVATDLLSIASPANVAGSATVEGVESTELPEGAEGVEAPEGVEGPDMPGDVGPNVDHQFDGEETGENGNGVSGTAGR